MSWVEHLLQGATIIDAIQTLGLFGPQPLFGDFVCDGALGRFVCATIVLHHVRDKAA